MREEREGGLDDDAKVMDVSVSMEENNHPILAHC